MENVRQEKRLTEQPVFKIFAIQVLAGGITFLATGSLESSLNYIFYSGLVFGTFLGTHFSNSTSSTKYTVLSALAAAFAASVAAYVALAKSTIFAVIFAVLSALAAAFAAKEKDGKLTFWGFFEQLPLGIFFIPHAIESCLAKRKKK